jgi:hypothetical protein
MEWYTVLILVVGGLILLLPLAFILYLNIGGLYHMIRQERSKKEEILGLTCSIDSDCPPGYVCLDGMCVPAT